MSERKEQAKSDVRKTKTSKENKGCKRVERKIRERGETRERERERGREK